MDRNNVAKKEDGQKRKLRSKNLSTHSIGQQRTNSCSHKESSNLTSSSEYEETPTFSDGFSSKNETLQKSRSQTLQPGTSNNCAGNCVKTIQTLQKTVSRQAVEITELGDKIKDLELKHVRFRNCCSKCYSKEERKYKQKSNQNKSNERQAKSEAFMDYFILTEDGLEWLNNVYEAMKRRNPKADSLKRKGAVKDRARSTDLSQYMSEMENIRKQLSQRVVNMDDIYKLCRHFHKNAEPFIGNLKSKKHSLVETFNVTFLELENSRGSDSFNAQTLCEYYRGAEQQLFVEIVEHCIEEN